jgi:hypothetical protein
MMRSWRRGRRKPARVRDPRKVEDFFACMLVVRNLSEIGNAESPDSRRFQPDIVPDWRSWQARIATAPCGRASGQADVISQLYEPWSGREAIRLCCLHYRCSDRMLIGDASVRRWWLKTGKHTTCRMPEMTVRSSTRGFPGLPRDEAVAARPTAAFDAKWGNFVVDPGYFTKLVYEGV